MTSTQVRPTVTAAVHNPALPVVTEVPHGADDGKTWFLSVHIGGATLFFDSADELLTWHNALAAEMGALRHPPTGEMVSATPPTGWVDRFRQQVRG